MGITIVLMITAVFFYFGLGDFGSLLVTSLGFLSAAIVLGLFLAIEHRQILEKRRRMLERNEREAETYRQS